MDIINSSQLDLRPFSSSWNKRVFRAKLAGINKTERGCKSKWLNNYVWVFTVAICLTLATVKQLNDISSCICTSAQARSDLCSKVHAHLRTLFPIFTIWNANFQVVVDVCGLPSLLHQFELLTLLVGARTLILPPIHNKFCGFSSNLNKNHDTYYGSEGEVQTTGK